MPTELETMLQTRRLPALLSREKMKEILLRDEYGRVPDVPVECKVDGERLIENRLDGGRCAVSEVRMTVSSEYGSCSFPVFRLLHHDGKRHPLIVFLNFRRDVPDFYYPAELAAEKGFEVLSFCYEDVTKDDPDFSDGLAQVLTNGAQTEDDSCGKIVIWACAAMRALDYGLTLDSVDPDCCAVLGHSRLGKTALVAGMLDERFRFVCSNSSGCGGASLYRGSLGQTGGKGQYGGPGESLSCTWEKINFRYWYCRNRYQPRWMEQNYPDSFDQHYLLACIAPRYVLVGSSDEDDWADPVSEQLCCLAAGKMWEDEYSLPGLVHAGRILTADEDLPLGHIGYHRRRGPHFLGSRDWEIYMDFIRLHEADPKPVNGKDALL